MKFKKIKKIIIVMILILLIILLGLMFILYKNISTNRTIDSEINVIKNQDNKKDSNKETENTSINSNIYFEKNGKLYTTSGEPAEGIDFEIRGVPEDVTNYISDVKAFYNTIKEYIFSYGLSEKAKVATYKRYEYQQESQRLGILFTLDDNKNSEVIFILNLNTNTVDISF